jgi:hypothetical protein
MLVFIIVKSKEYVLVFLREQSQDMLAFFIKRAEPGIC